MPTPEELARVNIDKQLDAAGWIVQDYRALNLGLGVAVWEFALLVIQIESLRGSILKNAFEGKL